MTLAVASHASSVGTGLTIAATEPSGIANGDLLLAFIAKSTAGTPSTIPAGWQQVVINKFVNQGGAASGGSAGATVGSGWAGVYWKEASSESGPYTWGSTSATWNVQTLRVAGYVGTKPGGVMVGSAMFLDVSVHSRNSTVIDQTNIPPRANLFSDQALMISGWVQISATTTTFSALPGTMTSLTNSSQALVTQHVAWEYLNLKTTPDVGNRAITTSSATGTGGGYTIIITDPTSITGDDNRISPRVGHDAPSRGKLVN